MKPPIRTSLLPLAALVVAALALPASQAQQGYQPPDVNYTPAPKATPKPAPTGPSEAEKKAIAAKAQAEEAARSERQRRERAEAEREKTEAKLRQQEAEIARLKAAAAPPAAPVATPTPAPQPPALARHPTTGQPLQAKNIITEAHGPRMVVIPPPPGGRFTMGSPSGEDGHQNDERQHPVTLNYVFAMAETETTFAQWDACVADGGCSGNSDVNAQFGRGQQPVINVTWHQARQYADWLTKKLGLSKPYHYRLPSEAEWEYAARAGNSGPFGFANNANISPALARYRWSESYAGSPTKTSWLRSNHPDEADVVANPYLANLGIFVTHYPISAFGLHHMHGNVWEWVADCYESDYSKVPATGAAHREDDAACSYRVLRGGSWFSFPQYLRAAVRDFGTPANRNYGVGFRLARMLPSGS